MFLVVVIFGWNCIVVLESKCSSCVKLHSGAPYNVTCQPAGKLDRVLHHDTFFCISNNTFFCISNIYKICVSILNLYLPCSLEQIIWDGVNLAVFEINPLQSIQLENRWRCSNSNLPILPFVQLCPEQDFEDWPLVVTICSKLKWQFAELKLEVLNFSFNWFDFSLVIPTRQIQAQQIFRWPILLSWITDRKIPII